MQWHVQFKQVSYMVVKSEQNDFEKPHLAVRSLTESARRLVPVRSCCIVIQDCLSLVQAKGQLVMDA
jgi:hypothetical protein